VTFATAFESAAQHATTLDGADLSNHANVDSVSSSPNDALVSGAIYDVKIEYQDAYGNTASNATNTSFIYDITTPVISSVLPTSSSFQGTTQVSYTLDEAATSGKITWTRTGGSIDGGSPHVQALAGAELNTGAHNNITLTNDPTLVEGAIYTIDFDVTDAAGNAATQVSSVSVTYDFTTLTPTLTTPADSSNHSEALTSRI